MRRYQHTTRLSRRVVSLFVILAALGFGSLVFGGMLWYGRDTTSAAAPQDTEIVLHFSPNRLTWDNVERALQDIPLISGRPLTASDIKPFTNGEFSVFIETDGTRSLAIRSNQDDLPSETLDTLGILTEEVKNGVFLLSDRPKARTEWKPARVWTAWMHWPNVTRIGTIHLLENDESTRGAIYSGRDRLHIRLPNQHVTHLAWKTLPEGTIAALSTPALPNSGIDTVAYAIDRLLSSYAAPSAHILSQRFLTEPGGILLRKQGESINFLLSSSSNAFGKDQEQALLQASAAFTQPRIQTLVLPDETEAQEIIVDPSLSTVEETTIGGALVSRVAAHAGTYLYSAEHEGSFAMTDDQELLGQWIDNERTNENRSSSCDGNAFYLNLQELLRLSTPITPSRSAELIPTISAIYPKVSVDTNFLFTTIHLCH